VNEVRVPLDALFGELPLKRVMASEQDSRAHGMFNKAGDALSRGDPRGAVTNLGSIACTARFDPWGLPLSPLSSSNPCNTGSTLRHGTGIWHARRHLCR
jgi:hypothetical protein